MLKHSSLAAAFAAIVAAATAAPAAPATSALAPCGVVTAASKTWHVTAIGVTCRAARGIVAHVAVKKPDHILHRAGGEIDQFVAPISGLRCFRSEKAKVGGEINCSSTDSKRTVLAVYKR